MNLGTDYDEHPECPRCGSDQTDKLTDPLGIEPTTVECHQCGASSLHDA